MANDLLRKQGKIFLNSQVNGPPYRYVEYIGKDGQGGPTGNWLRNSTQITTVMEVYGFLGRRAEDVSDEFYNAFVELPAALMGWSSVATDRATKKMKLIRFMPQQCPYAPWLYAESVTNVRGVAFSGKGNRFGGDISQYERVRMNVTYTTRPYLVASDADLAKTFGGDESARFVEKHPKPTAEYIQVDRGFFEFSEGPPGHPGPDPLNPNPLLRHGQRIPMGFGFVTVKVDLEWTWHAVPEVYLFADTGRFPKIFDAGQPTNIINGLGKVNAGAIWGYPAGTLLCLPPELIPVEQPVYPGKLGLPPGSQPRAWNVRFRFKYWDPPVEEGAVTHGHNVALWPENATFFGITGLNGTNRPYRPYNFALFFQPADPNRPVVGAGIPVWPA